MYKLDEPQALEDFKSWIAAQPRAQVSTVYPVSRTCPLARFLQSRNPEAKNVFVGFFVYGIDEFTSLYMPEWANRIRGFTDALGQGQRKDGEISDFVELLQ